MAKGIDGLHAFLQILQCQFHWLQVSNINRHPNNEWWRLLEI